MISIAALALKVTNLWNCKVGPEESVHPLTFHPTIQEPSSGLVLAWIWRYVKCDILFQRSNQGWWRGIVGEIKHVASMQGVANWLRASGSHLWLCTIIFLPFGGNFRVCGGKKLALSYVRQKWNKVWIGKVYASGLSSPKCTLLGFDMWCLSTCRVNSQRRKLLGSSSEFELFVFLCHTTIGSTAKRLSVENVIKQMLVSVAPWEDENSTMSGY